MTLTCRFFMIPMQGLILGRESRGFSASFVHRELISNQFNCLVCGTFETVWAESGQAFASAAVRPCDRTSYKFSTAFAC